MVSLLRSAPPSSPISSITNPRSLRHNLGRRNLLPPISHHSALAPILHRRRRRHRAPGLPSPRPLLPHLLRRLHHPPTYRLLALALPLLRLPYLPKSSFQPFRLASQSFTALSTRHHHRVGPVPSRVWRIDDPSADFEEFPLRHHADRAVWDVSPTSLPQPLNSREGEQR